MNFYRKVCCSLDCYDDHFLFPIIQDMVVIMTILEEATAMMMAMKTLEEWDKISHRIIL